MDSDREQESSPTATAADPSSRFHSAFLAAMSHELRTPLNGIIGFAELMHSGRAGALSSTQREYLGDVLGCARQVLRLVNDLDELARLDSGGDRPRTVPVDLPRVVAEVIETLRDQAATKRIAVAAEIGDDVRPIVGIATSTRQVVHHYLAAALRFAREGDRVAVCCRAEGTGSVRLDVEEIGTAIPQADMAPLLLEFDQVAGRSNMRQRGIGLGLALARRLVMAQGGRVEFSSRPGAGGAFSAIWPCAAVVEPGGRDGA